MRVCVVTTSYPRSAGDVAGAFVAAQVERSARPASMVEVVSPADVRHFGIAYGDGIVQNLRAKPWLVAALPLFLGSLALAARRAARDADVVHAHWIPSALAARLRPASRSCCRCGEPTSSSPAARPGSPGSRSAAPGS